MSVRSMVGWDVRLQYRYGFYAVYAVVTALFVLGLQLFPGDVRTQVLVLVLFGDPGFLGFYFVGALVLFEKGEGVLDALVTSPLSVRSYLVSKVLSLTLISLLGATVVAVLVHGTDIAWASFLGGIGLTAAVFVLVGFVAVARFDSLNTYFMTAMVYMIPLSLPLLPFFGIVEHPAFYLVPTQASLVLIGAAFEPTPLWELGYGVGYLLVWILVAYVLAHRAFVTHVVRATGGGESSTAPQRSGILSGRDLGPIASLALADLRNWARDPLLVYVGIAPYLIGIVARVGIGPVDAALTFVDVSAYSAELLAGLLLTPATVYGFVAGFFVLEDRDQGVLQALRTTPLTGRGYLQYRALVFLSLSVVATLVTIPLVGLGTLPPLAFVAIAVVASLHTAVTALLMVSLAANTVEGVAVSKLLGFLVMGPILGIVFLAEPIQFVTGIVPTYWVAKATVAAVTGEGSVFAYLAVGVGYQLLVVAVLLRTFLARSD